MVTDTVQLRDERERQQPRYSVWAFLAPMVGVALGLGLLYGAMRGAQARYEGRIYPGVSVQGVALGAMTPERARAALSGALSPEASGFVTLTDGEGEWPVPWSALGMAPDVEATVAAAYAIGHGPDDRAPRRWVETWLGDHAVEPLLLVNAVVAREGLASTAAVVDRVPTTGTLRLDGDRVVVVPGVAGRALDVEASLEALLWAAQGEGGPVRLAFRALPPAAPDTGPTLARVDALVERTVALLSYDPVRDEAFRRDLGRPEIASWLRLEGGADGGTPNVTVDPGRVEATLTSLAEGLGEGRGFRLAEATFAVLEALDKGGGEVTLYMTHPERRYIVQPGDTALVVAARHGMPLWTLAQANPGVSLDMLRAGQELVIPSQDVLTPHPPVPGKRIVVSIGEQRMRVYQDGAVRHDWPVATGREGSPTHTGVFQVLSKEESAYASLWDLHMPHFIGIYAAGPGFTNGIHALPILSNGQRLWAGSLGTPVSYGCIILGVAEAQTLYEWAEAGVTVEIRR